MYSLILGWALLFVGAAWAADLRLASDIWPPFTDRTGHPSFATELVHEALARAGYPAKTTTMEFEAVIQGLGMGNHDGSAALWKDPERENYLLFSAPYLENRLVLVGRKGDDVAAKSLADLKGRKVGVVAGYSYGEAVEAVEAEDGPAFVEGGSDQENLSLLLAGQIEFMLVDELLISHVLDHQPDEVGQHLEIGTNPLISRPLHFAVLKGYPGAETIVAKFNESIREMITDGTYNRILGLNWIRADVDGDGRLELVHGTGAAGSEAPSDGYRVGDAPADTSGADIERFWIEGKMYETWEDVPEKYKYSGPGEVKEDPGMTLYRLDF
jgi:ABC-type amino acid transport substrate-binding protein